jgi:hypothetical protein
MPYGRNKGAIRMSNVINMRDQRDRVTDQSRVIQIMIEPEKLMKVQKENEKKALAKFFFGLGFGFVSFYLLTAFLLSL